MSPSFDQAQSQIILAWDLSDATKVYLGSGELRGCDQSFVTFDMKGTIHSPSRPPFLSYNLHDRSRETLRTYLSSGGLKATLVIVNECPSNGVPTGRWLSCAELMRTTACAGDVDLHVEANIVFDEEAVIDID